MTDNRAARCDRCSEEFAEIHLEVTDPDKGVLHYYLCKNCQRMAADMVARFVGGRRYW